MTTAAEKALAAYDEMYKIESTGEYLVDTGEAQVAADLAAALRATLPTFEVFERGPGKGTTLATLDTRAEAQDWIARTDPAARRDLWIRQGKPRG